MPLPWVNDEDTGFLNFGRDAERAHTDRLCAVCGEELHRVIVLGAVFEPEQRLTNGPGAHPRCFALALRFCPHFDARYDDADVVGFVYRGCGLGYVTPPEREPYEEFAAPVYESAEPISRADARALARTNPLGD